jgi:hypothetical protein
VTLETLRAEFTSPAWADLKNENSILSKILLSSAFKNAQKGQSAGQIDSDTMILYGVLLCQGNPSDKAEIFYSVLQEGGKDAHDFITASDKDLDPVIQKLCDLVTKDAYLEFTKIAGLQQLYTEEDLEKLSGDTISAFKEDVYLDDVFGNFSRLEYSEWNKQSVSKALYMFNTKTLRNKLLDHAGLENKY